TRADRAAAAGADSGRTPRSSKAARRTRRASAGCGERRRETPSRAAATAGRAERATAAWPSGLRPRPIPVLLALVGACHRVEHLGVPGLLELLERLAAHRRVDVQVRRADDGTELLEHEEEHAVMDHRAPVAAAHHVALRFREARLLERPLRILEKELALLRNDQIVQEAIQPIRANGRLDRERIRPFELLYARELTVDSLEIIRARLVSVRLGNVFENERRDRRHRRQVVR